MEEVKKTTTRKKTTKSKEEERLFTMEELKAEMAKMMLEMQMKQEQEKAEIELQLRKEIEEDIKKEQESIAKKKQVINTMQNVDLSREVLCRSVCCGELGILSNEGMFYEFDNYGSEQFISIRELRAMLNSKGKAFFSVPYIIVDDEEAIDVLKLRDKYEKMWYLNDIPALFNNHTEEEIVNKFNEMSQYTRMTIIEKLMAMYKDGTFKQQINDGLEVVTLINRLFKIKINE